MESTRSVRLSALLVAMMSSFLTPFMGSSISIASPAIRVDFNVTDTMLTWVGTVYLLAAVMFLVPFGKLADIYGRKRIYTFGILIDTIATGLGALSPSYPLLLLFRFLQGFGDAMIFGTSVAILTTVYPMEQRGQVLGISVAATYAGLSLGPFFGGFLTLFFAWRSVFVFTVLIDVSILFALHWLRGEWFGERGAKFDSAGSLLYILTLFGVIIGFTLLPALFGTCIILAGCVAFVGFLLREFRVSSPVLDLRQFRHNVIFAYSNLAALINYMATFAVTYLLSLYLQQIQGFNPGVAGLILIPQPIVMAIVSPIAGRVSDKVEPRIVASTGMAVTTVGLVMLVFIHDGTGLAFIIGSELLLGLGFGLFSSPNTNAVMSSVERRIYGVASATLGTMRLVGQTFSLGIATLAFSVGIGALLPNSPSFAPVFLASMDLQFLVFAILCGIGVIASLARGRLREKNSPNMMQGIE